MQKEKILLAVCLIAPFFTITSCNNNGNETPTTPTSVTITLDTGVGTFKNGDCYRTLTIDKGRTLKDILENDVPVSESTFLGKSENFTNPACWVDDSDKIFNIENSINDDMTLHARFFLSINEAREFGLQKIGVAFMDAIARQPEAVQALSTAYQLASEHISKAPSEGSAIAMGKIVSSEMDACARQPEAIKQIYTNAEFYYVSLEEDANMSNTNALGLGKIGVTAMDALARQPEAHLEFNEASETFVEVNKKLPVYSGYGFGKFGSAYMDACARQVEKMATLLEKTPTIFEGFEKARNSFQSLAIGSAAGGWADACARQPEHIANLSTGLYRNIEDILKN